MASSGRAVEVQRGVGLWQVYMTADLHRPVAGVDDVENQPWRTGIERDVTLAEHDLTRDHSAPHEIGLWTVTSLVPSGKVASTWTSCSISGTPSMTCSRVSTSRPLTINSATVRPSRAPSSR